MKTKYILKTSNDLTFEFDGEEKLLVRTESIFLSGGPFPYVVQVSVNFLDSLELPLKIITYDEEYTINYFSKVKSI